MALFELGKDETEKLAAFIRRRVSSAEDSEDIMQEIKVHFCEPHGDDKGE